MDRKRNQAALKGKEKVRALPTQVSPRLAALRVPQSPPLKTRTPPSRASPRLTALKDSLLPPSPTSKDPEIPIPEMTRTTKVRRTTRISVKPIWRRFSERVIAKGEPSRAAPEEKDVIDVSSDSEMNKKIEDAAMELIAMDEAFISEEEEDPEEEEEEEHPKVEEEVLEHFRDEDDYEDYFSAEDDNSSNGSIGSN
ncbi:hypothetical protein PIB30_088232 [Stylosanthes scabra]|uniref:Uncharacterized protein n=1 Tax=Stylosanthes scabra TaxID=79078 RepID=A0ABU6ZSG4_9FABA|nr:hypothetical protein [Stylosanthes scabra]